MKKVSIIIVSHNEGTNLARTVQSVRETCDSRACEIVVIDDGSDDPGDAASLGTDLVTHRSDKSAGLAKARHHGACLASGSELVFLDAHMALAPGWLDELLAARRRWGPWSAVTPSIAHLEPDRWKPRESNGQTLVLDDHFEMVWESRRALVPMVPVVLGCCWIIARDFYFTIGGFDLGLTRWGCENIDAIAKVYAFGGACFEEQSVTVGHLFRERFPYTTRHDEITYNKLRTGFVHLPEKGFRRLWINLSTKPGFEEARDRFTRHFTELRHIRARHRLHSRRSPAWFAETFLPSLAR